MRLGRHENGTKTCYIPTHLQSQFTTHVTHLLEKSPFVFPSMARSAVPYQEVLLCEAEKCEFSIRSTEKEDFQKYVLGSDKYFEEI